MVFCCREVIFSMVFSRLGTGSKVAKSHSSSKTKKEPKASFSIGFRSYVRHFRGAILGLLPSFRGMCFAAGSDFFHGVFPSEDQQQQQQKPLQQQAEKVARIHSSSKREKKQPKASIHHHFLWVSGVTLGIFEVQFWGFSVLQRHGVLLPGGDFFHCVFPFGDRM